MAPSWPPRLSASGVNSGGMDETPQEAAARAYVYARYSDDHERAAGTPSISRSSPISIGLGGAPFVGEDGNGESWILVIGDNREVSLLRTIEDTDDSPGAVETRSFGRMADATVIASVT